MSKVTITVSGSVGSGKSAICGEIEILCKALGLQVEWVGGDQEKNLTGADWIHEIEMYKPEVTIIERLDRKQSAHTADGVFLKTDPAEINLLLEAWNFGQFADDADWPLARPIREALRNLCQTLQDAL